MDQLNQLNQLNQGGGMVYTKKKLKDLKATLAKIENCNGCCAICMHMMVECRKDEKAFYFAVGCDLAPDFIPIANQPNQLRAALRDQLKFELKVVEDGLRHESRRKADKATAGLA